MHWPSDVVPCSLRILAAQGADSDTPLHLAALYGHAECVRLLLERGARADVADSDGTLPACCCLPWRQLAACKMKSGPSPVCMPKAGSCVAVTCAHPLTHARPPPPLQARCRCTMLRRAATRPSARCCWMQRPAASTAATARVRGAVPPPLRARWAAALPASLHASAVSAHAAPFTAASAVHQAWPRPCIFSSIPPACPPALQATRRSTTQRAGSTRPWCNCWWTEGRMSPCRTMTLRRPCSWQSAARRAGRCLRRQRRRQAARRSRRSPPRRQPRWPDARPLLHAPPGCACEHETLACLPVGPAEPAGLPTLSDLALNFIDRRLLHICIPALMPSSPLVPSQTAFCSLHYCKVLLAHTRAQACGQEAAAAGRGARQNWGRCGRAGSAQRTGVWHKATGCSLCPRLIKEVQLHTTAVRPPGHPAAPLLPLWPGIQLRQAAAVLATRESVGTEPSVHTNCAIHEVDKEGGSREAHKVGGLVRDGHGAGGSALELRQRGRGRGWGRIRAEDGWGRARAE